jgi:hypothetical protein
VTPDALKVPTAACSLIRTVPPELVWKRSKLKEPSAVPLNGKV